MQLDSDSTRAGFTESKFQTLISRKEVKPTQEQQTAESQCHTNSNSEHHSSILIVHAQYLLGAYHCLVRISAANRSLRVDLPAGAA